jgi:antitoxin component HigA of HigAB toxin-antitoxin module
MYNTITKITNNKEYQEAMAEIDKYFELELEPKSFLGKYLCKLIDLVIEYEEVICPEATMFKCDEDKDV